MPRASKCHDFVLYLGQADEITDSIDKALYEAGCSDGTICVSNCELHISFTRAAATLREAVSSAIKDVRDSGLGRAVTRIEPAEAARAVNFTAP